MIPGTIQDMIQDMIPDMIPVQAAGTDIEKQRSRQTIGRDEGCVARAFRI